MISGPLGMPEKEVFIALWSWIDSANICAAANAAIQRKKDLDFQGFSNFSLVAREVLGIDISASKFDATRYDRIFGENAAKRALDTHQRRIEAQKLGWELVE